MEFCNVARISKKIKEQLFEDYKNESSVVWGKFLRS